MTDERLPWVPEKVQGIATGEGWVAQDADGRWLWGIVWRRRPASWSKPDDQGARHVIPAVPGRRRGGREATREAAVNQVARWANGGRPDHD